MPDATPRKPPRSIRLPALVARALKGAEASYGAQLTACLDASEGEISDATMALAVAPQDVRLEVYLSEPDGAAIIGLADRHSVRVSRILQILAMIAVARLARTDDAVVRAARAYQEARQALINAWVDPALHRLILRGSS